MNGAPDQDAVKATKEDSVITEAARAIGRHQGRTFDVNAPKTDTPLETIKCTIKFGGLVAVNELDMSVRRGEIYGLIGPNGAGKTTIFNLLIGATALSLGYSVLTVNPRHFRRVPGLAVIQL